MPDKQEGLSIGITGGIGSGKTLISRIFRNLGIAVYYSDERARHLMNHDEMLSGQIREMFGPESFLEGKLNREFLASEVFSRKEKLDQLNQLVHPAVQQDFREWKKLHADDPYCMKEAAMLFETGSYRELDKTILVLAPEHLRIQRILLRDPHRSTADVKGIMASQMPDEEKKKLADYTIVNDDSRLVIPQALKIHRLLAGNSLS
jgi:dephospho-CoA kinase